MPDGTLAYPPLDVTRALHLEAFASLIAERLSGRSVPAIVAPRLLAELCEHAGFDLDTPDPARPTANVLTAFGIRATGDTAYALLFNWRSAARTRIAEGRS